MLLAVQNGALREELTILKELRKVDITGIGVATKGETQYILLAGFLALWLIIGQLCSWREAIELCFPKRK